MDDNALQTLTTGELHGGMTQSKLCEIRGKGGGVEVTYMRSHHPLQFNAFPQASQSKFKR